MNRILTLLLLCHLTSSSGQIPNNVDLALNFLNFELWSNEDCDNNTFVFLDTLGNNVLDKTFNSATDFYTDYANVVIDRQFGIIDKAGNIKHFEEYDKIFWYTDSLGIAQKDSLYGFINVKGEVLIPLMYQDVSFFNEGFAGINLKGKRNFINKENELIFHDSITLKGKSLFPIFLTNDSLLIYEGKCEEMDSKNTFGILDITSNKLTPPCYDYISGTYSDGICLVKKGGKFGFIDKKGIETIEVKYDFYGKQSEGLVPMRKGRIWGYLNYHGEIVIDFQYNSAKEFYNGIALVKKDGKELYINTKGEILLELNEVKASLYYYKFHDGLAVVKKGNKELYINLKGEEKEFEHSFDKARKFIDGFACVQVDSKWGVINKTGDFIIEPKYDEIWNYANGMFRAMTEAK